MNIWCSVGNYNQHCACDTDLPGPSDRFFQTFLFTDYCFIDFVGLRLPPTKLPSSLLALVFSTTSGEFIYAFLILSRIESSKVVLVRPAQPSNHSFLQRQPSTNRSSTEPAMPATRLYHAHTLLENNAIILLPHGDEDPNYNLIGIVIGSIAAFTLFSVFVGCCTAIRSRRRIQRRQIEKAAALDLERASSTPGTSGSTLVGDRGDNQDDVIERRTAHLMDNDTFVGRELVMFRKSKPGTRKRGSKNSSVMLPVRLDDLRKWARGSHSAGIYHEDQAGSLPPRPSSGLHPDHGPVATHPAPAHRGTSIDYDEPSKLANEIRSSVPGG